VTRTPEDSTPAVAVIGGGQLARMMAQAAVGLGVPLRLLAEEPDASAAQVLPDSLVGDYRDLETLSRSTTSTSPPSTCVPWRRRATRAGPARTRSCTPRTRR
jgi:hypothetical protein